MTDLPTRELRPSSAATGPATSPGTSDSHYRLSGSLWPRTPLFGAGQSHPQGPEMPLTPPEMNKPHRLKAITWVIHTINQSIDTSITQLINRRSINQSIHMSTTKYQEIVAAMPYILTFRLQNWLKWGLRSTGSLLDGSNRRYFRSRLRAMTSWRTDISVKALLRNDQHCHSKTVLVVSQTTQQELLT